MKSIPRWLRFAILAVAVFSAVAVARDARAALIFTINLDQDGNPTDPAVQISITENAGALDYIVSIVPNPNNIGDLRGSFIDIALMGGLLPAGSRSRERT